MEYTLLLGVLLGTFCSAECGAPGHEGTRHGVFNPPNSVRSKIVGLFAEFIECLIYKGIFPIKLTVYKYLTKTGGIAANFFSRSSHVCGWVCI
jgi:hypothetical protein